MFMRGKHLFIVFLLLLLVAMTGCTEKKEVAVEKEKEVKNEEKKDVEKQEFEKLPGEITLSKSSVDVGERVKLSVIGLEPNKSVSVIWNTVDGTYQLKNLYMFVKADYKDTQVELAKGTATQDGSWEGEIVIPEDFGGDHDLELIQDEKKMAKTNIFVKTKFEMLTMEGPIGSDIVIKGKGIGWREYGSLWHLNYDNKYTGMITAVSTKGTATTVIRAAGPVGKHSITIESGAFGMPYINRIQSPHSYIETHRFTFNVTNEKPKELTFVDSTPESAASGGVKMPDVKMKDGVTVELSKIEGNVNDSVSLTAKGLPSKQKIEVIWNTMVGNRVTAAGFTEKQTSIGTFTSSDTGDGTLEFKVPDDLGGPPHRIDVKVGDEIQGQTYFKIIPSIVSMEPKSGPVGTEITIEIKGVGWTEYDNIYNIVYDNAFLGYACGFNSQGTVKFQLAASGEPGYHIIDLYPGIYKGEQQMPEMFIRPQLTFREDHPGSRIPAVRFGFLVTE